MYTANLYNRSSLKTVHRTLATCDAMGERRTHQGKIRRGKNSSPYCEGSSESSRRCGTPFIGADEVVLDLFPTPPWGLRHRQRPQLQRRQQEWRCLCREWDKVLYVNFWRRAMPIFIS
jgi:hypothetical protein